MRHMLALFVLTLLTASLPGQDPLAGGGFRGTWSSETHGNSGPMRAFVRPRADGEYRVMFVGRFLKVVPFAYPAKLSVVGTTADGVMLSGSRRLGPFGTFTMTGTLTPNALDAEFHAKSEHGRFTLTR